MGNLVVVNHVTLDGVMQAPGRPDEDTRGGFQHGGWAEARGDEVMGRKLGEGIARGQAAREAGRGGVLLGRWTYESFAAYWPHQHGNPFSEVLDNTHKYVASKSLREPLPWGNSTLLGGDLGEEVRALKRDGYVLTVLGSGDLIQSLIGHDLIDEYLLMIHPLVLGSGRRMFPDGGPSTELVLTESVTTTTGVIMATYRPATPTDAAGDDGRLSATARE
jgi:dihydrofolate reductase